MDRRGRPPTCVESEVTGWAYKTVIGLSSSLRSRVGHESGLPGLLFRHPIQG